MVVATYGPALQGFTRCVTVLSGWSTGSGGVRVGIGRFCKCMARVHVPPPWGKRPQPLIAKQQCSHTRTLPQIGTTIPMVGLQGRSGIVPEYGPRLKVARRRPKSPIWPCGEAPRPECGAWAFHVTLPWLATIKGIRP